MTQTANEERNRFILLRYANDDIFVVGFYATEQEAKGHAEKLNDPVSIYKLAGDCEDLAE